MNTLRMGDQGEEVVRLQVRLKARGFDPGAIDGDFGPGTHAAVLAFQASAALLVDGVAGPRTLKALALVRDDVLTSVLPQITPRLVSEMFPFTPIANIKRYLPAIVAALDAGALRDAPMVLMALATVRAETESFLPVAEGRSRFNTSPNGHGFDLYDHRRDLGNRGPRDGERFRGRGFVQLTGRANYRTYGVRLGLGTGLERNPDRATDPDVAARLLVAFLADKERAIKLALLDRNFLQARRLVNGGSHGLDRFTAAYLAGEQRLG
ncbi:MAG: peptidoglycan-binding protein [Burkholderiales bacterium]|nr:peptidoglycan-binding protein [Burkholderiales bacterium]